VPQLVDAGIFTGLDRPMFTTLVQNLGLVDKLSVLIDRKRLTQQTKRGGESSTPLIRIRNQTQAMAVRMMLEFGLAPSSRSRLQIGLPEPRTVLTNPSDARCEQEIDEEFFGAKS